MRRLVADALGMTRVFIHPLAGVLSAYGMGLADQIAMREAALERDLDDRGLMTRPRRWLRGCWTRLPRNSRRRGWRAIALHVAWRGFMCAIRARTRRCRATCRRRLPPRDALRASSRGIRAAAIGAVSNSSCPDHALVIEAVSVECIAPGADAPHARARRGRERAEYEPLRGRRMFPCIAWPTLQARRLARGASVSQPQELRDGRADRRVRPFSPTAMRPPWSSPVGCAGAVRGGCIELRRVQRASRRASRSAPMPIRSLLELFNNIFMNIAEQMGLRLQNTAYSVNIKERLDFSCALFDAQGR